MSYFVRIKDARSVRRRILESSKEMLYALKGHYQMLELRDQKRETAEALRSTLSELGELAAKLQSLLPAESLKEIEQYLPKKRKQKSSKKESKKAGEEKNSAEKDKSKPSETPMSEMERLEKALANIEERLSKL